MKACTHNKSLNPCKRFSKYAKEKEKLYKVRLLNTAHIIISLNGNVIIEMSYSITIKNGHKIHTNIIIHTWV